MIGHLDVPRFDGPALCAETDPEAFYPEKGGSTRDAKKLCGLCPVQAECLAWALGRGERYGVWGGLSERERRRLHRQPAATVTVRERVARDIDHGTDAGYKAHRRLGEDACRDCRTAHDDDQRPAAPLPAPVVVERPGVTRPWTPDEQVKAVRFLTEYGMTAAEIAPELDVSVRHVQRIQRLTASRRGAA